MQLAAVRLFLERGYVATTMDDVAEAAGVGRTTVFRYFTGKPALVWWDLDANYARLDEHLSTAPLTATQAPEADGYVVLVQAELPGKYGLMPGAILGAARSAR